MVRMRSKWSLRPARRGGSGASGWSTVPDTTRRGRLFGLAVDHPEPTLLAPEPAPVREILTTGRTARPASGCYYQTA